MKLLRAFLEGKISENQKNEGKVKKLIAGRGNDLMVFKLCINCFNYAAFFGWKSSSRLRKIKRIEPIKSKESDERNSLLIAAYFVRFTAPKMREKIFARRKMSCFWRKFLGSENGQIKALLNEQIKQFPKHIKITIYVTIKQRIAA